MAKILSLSQVTRLAHTFRRQGKTVGLITGCFDVIHLGHIRTFRYAKDNCDLVIVGLENDETIRISKGSNRPIHTWKDRAELLAELTSIDCIFKIRKVTAFGTPGAEDYYIRLMKQLNPHYLVTNSLADHFWRNKRLRCQETGVKLLVSHRRRPSSSTGIIAKLSQEN